ncbi:MAG: hypothetical protein H0W84_12810, partial [Bacteroidetes bacterium]|nr:hypothetical protein [Bacteroidota bacterium]
MKNLILLLLIVPAFCFAQTENVAAPKPATDDCPSWKKPKSSGKADYFQFLRTGKSSKGQMVNGVYYPSAPPQVSSGTPIQRPEQNPYLEAKKERKAKQNPPTKNNTVVPEVEPEIAKEEKIEEVPAEVV